MSRIREALELEAALSAGGDTGHTKRRRSAVGIPCCARTKRPRQKKKKIWLARLSVCGPCIPGDGSGDFSQPNHGNLLSENDPVVKIQSFHSWKTEGGGDSNSRVPRPKVGAFRPPSRRHGGRGRRPRAPKVLWGPRQVAQGAVHLDLVRRDLLQARREDREEGGQVRQDSEAQG